MPKRLLLVAAAAACTQPNNSLPWLRGAYTPMAVTDDLSSRPLEKLASWQSCDGPCTDYGGMELVADVAPSPGSETILASYSAGIVVLDGAGHLLARSGSFEPAGSADDLVALAVADASLEVPVIAIAVRTGGRREHQTRLELHRVGANTRLERLFSAVVEQHEDQTDAVGTVTFTNGGLLYRAPGGRFAERWVFDPRVGKYIARGPEPTFRSGR